MRAMNAMMRAVTIACALSAGSCSLLQLDRFDLADCTSSDLCEPLNARDGITADACMRWQCAPTHHACVMSTRDADGDQEPPLACGGRDCDDHNAAVNSTGTEVCDGADNNCDGVVDEGTLAPQGGTRLLSGLTSPGTLGVVRDPAGELLGFYQYDDAVGVHHGGAVALPEPAAGATTQNEQAFSWAADSNEAEMSALRGTTYADRCTAANDSCNVAAIAVDGAGAANGPLFVAAVSTNACTTGGQLRIGYDVRAGTSITPANSIVQRGPAVRSDIVDGVDVGAGHCTGASRTSGPVGATRPALASYLPGAGRDPQALVAWIGDGLSRASCGGTAVDVDVLGVYLESNSTNDGPINWVNATGDTTGGPSGRGTPQVVGTTVGGARPAVVALAGSYVVGFGSDATHVTLRGVGPFADPPAFNPSGVAGAALLDTRVTPLLALGTPLSLPAPGGADHVTIATGPASGSATELGITWESGCETASAKVYFQRVSFAASPTGGAFTLVDAAPTEITTAADVSARDPSVVYVPEGFVTTGHMGATATGGWLLAWVDRGSGGHVMARRVAEFDGQPLGAAVDVAIAPVDARLAETSLASASDTPASVVLAYGGLGAGEVVGARLLCAAATH